VNYNLPKLTFSIVSNHLNAGHEVPCLRCESRFRLGLAEWAMCARHEVVGYVCARCLTPSARRDLEEATFGELRQA
jgi:hypothetical protein